MKGDHREFCFQCQGRDDLDFNKINSEHSRRNPPWTGGLYQRILSDAELDRLVTMACYHSLETTEIRSMLNEANTRKHMRVSIGI